MYNQHLDTLLYVMECGSFSKAAERLFISPTAVMNQMNSLEQHLGIKLMDRTSSGVVLTAAGTCVCRYARQIIQLSRQAVQEANEVTRRKQYVIRVGSSLLKPCQCLMDLWRPLSADHPEFLLQVVPFMDSANSSIDSIIQFSGEKIDLFVSPSDRPVRLSSYQVYPMGYVDLCCAVPIQHRLAAKELLRPEDLHGEFLFTLPKGRSAVMDRIRSELTAQHPQITLLDTDLFYDINSFNRCAQENRLIITLKIWQNIHPSLVTIPMDWTCKMPYGIVCRKDPPKHIRDFLDLLRGSIQ